MFRSFTSTNFRFACPICLLQMSTSYAPPHCPRCSDLEQQLAKSQRKVAALDSQVSRMKERDKRSPCFYNVFNGRSWVAVERQEETYSDEQAEGEGEMEAAPMGEQKVAESAFRPIGITEEASAEPGAQQMQMSENESKQAESAASAIGMVRRKETATAGR